MKFKLPSFFHFIAFLAIIVTSCGEKYNDSNAVPASGELQPFVGTWTMTYYTDGKKVDTLSINQYGEWIQAHYQDELVFPSLRANKKVEFRVESEPRKYFEGTLMGNRWWGTMKFEKGVFMNQRIQWEGQRIEE